MSRYFCTFAICLLVVLSTENSFAQTASTVRAETRVDMAQEQFNVTGNGVIAALLDRGLDYEHPDFLNDDGTSRVLYFLDLTDDSGANDPANTAGIGTLYTKAQIDAALASGNRLDARDAVGHGTTTAGLIGGNGRASSGLYQGMAPDVSFIIVKFTTEGAAARDGEPAEDPFYQPAFFPATLDFIIEKADEMDMPLVALANFGSVGAISDGTSALAAAIDERFGPDIPGRVFVTGTSDDGGGMNHAGGTVNDGETAILQIRKGNAGNLRLQLWYSGDDRFDVQVITPSGASGPFTAPVAQTDRDTQSGADFSYFHNGTAVDFASASSNSREILIDFFGPVGDYELVITGATVTDGRFDAWLNPAAIFSGTENRFENFVEPGYTVWEMAAAQNNIAPNSYVLRTEWTDVDGVSRSVTDQGSPGELWPGSGIGPTVDGRFGVTVSAPGERLFAPYAPRSFFAQFRFNTVFDDGNGGLYGIQSAVSAASPIVTGIIALMLEADPTLDAIEVRDMLQQSARSDAFTGAVPNNSWGYGKVDAFGAVALAAGSGVANEKDVDLNAFELSRNYPNPFRTTTTISYTLPQADAVRLAVYDIMGREVRVLVDRAVSAGAHQTTFNAKGLAAGVYLYRLEAGSQTRTGVMSLIR